MTVSTEYFDYVFNNRDVAEGNLRNARGQLTYLEGRLERRQAILERRPERERAQRLVDRFERLVEKQKERVAKLQARSEELNGVELPVDKVAFEVVDVTDDITGIRVTITDSPYDDRFVGGEGNSYVVSGTSDRGGFTTTAAIDPDFADNVQSFGFADANITNRLDGSYDVTAQIVGPGTESFTATIV